MEIILNEIEVRVLGSLMEKSLSTPEYYPLSLNALTHACNQKSSREPVVDYDETIVQAAVDSLVEKALVNKSGVARVPKYEELLCAQRKFVPRETAALCALMLRGPQTSGEIRTRTNRLYAFENLEEVVQTLTDLSSWGFVKRLARMPGHKEARYAHLFLANAPEENTKDSSSDHEPPDPTLAERMEMLEQKVGVLQKDFEELKQSFLTFRDQFE